MSLTLITGPANSAKAGEVLGRFRTGLTRGCILVVPTWSDVHYYQREFTGSEESIGGVVTQFSGLVGEIARRTGYRQQVLSQAAKRRVIASAVAKTKLHWLVASAATPGFVSAIEFCFAQLHQAMIGPEQLMAKLQGENANQQAGWIAELALLFERYHTLLAHTDCVDKELFTWQALSKLREQPGRWGGTPICWYGFDDLTGLESDAISTFAATVGADVTLALPFESERVALAARAGLVQEMRAIATEQIDLSPQSNYYAVHSAPALHHLERNLFCDGNVCPTLEPDSCEQEAESSLSQNDAVVQVVQVTDRIAECEYIAGQITLMLHEGITPEAIAVVVRNPTDSHLVTRALSQHSIPHTAAVQLSAVVTPFGRSVIALLKCAFGRCDARELIVYLRTPGLVEKQLIIDHFEESLRRAGVSNFREALRWWERKHWPLGQLARLREHVAVRGPLGQPLLECLLREVNWLFALAGTRQRLHDENRYNLQSYRVIQKMLTDYCDLTRRGSDLAPTYAELVSELNTLQIEMGVSTEPGRVQIINPLAVRARRYQAVIICNLVAPVWPQQQATRPVVRGLSQALEHVRLGGDNDEQAQMAAEQALFYACCSRPEQKLILTYATQDTEGKECKSTPFINAVLKVFPGHLKVVRPAQDTSRPGPETLPEVRPWVGPALATKLVQKRVFAAGEVEAFAACSARWFVERCLRPQPLAGSSPALKRGSLAHRALQVVFERLQKEIGWEQVSLKHLSLAMEWVNEVLEPCNGSEKQANSLQSPDHKVSGRLQVGLLARDAVHSKGELTRMQADLGRYLKAYLEQPSPFQPTYFEVAFGSSNAELPAASFVDGAMFISGRIDRIDVNPRTKEAIVVDYKTSRAVPGARWVQAKSLQVALYMRAVEQLLDIKVVGGLYQPLQVQDIRPRGLVLENVVDDWPLLVKNDLYPRSEFHSMLDTLIADAAETVERVKAGDVFAEGAICQPQDCAYPALCRQAERMNGHSTLESGDCKPSLGSNSRSTTKTSSLCSGQARFSPPLDKNE